MIKKRYFYVFVLLILLFVVPSIFSSSSKLYVDNKNAEIKVIWSEDIQNPYAILKGGNLPGQGVSNINCDIYDTDFLCRRDQTNARIYYYNYKSELSDGNYSFTIYANDLYNNPMEDFVGKEFAVDTIAPLIENFSYMVAGTSSSGKVIDFIVDIADDEVLNQSPVLTIDNVTLSEVPATFLGNVYKYYYLASISDASKILKISVSDRAGNNNEVNKFISLTAPRPPVTNPYEGAVISPYTSIFSFFFYEKVPRNNMRISHKGVEISTTVNFVNSSSPYLKNMLYYYNVPGTLEGGQHWLTIEAWDDNNNRLGPYDVHFTVDPNAPQMPFVYFDAILAGSDISGHILKNNLPLIKFVFQEDNVNLTDINIITSNYSYIKANLQTIVKQNSKTFLYQTVNILPEGLNTVLFSACTKKDAKDSCLVNATASVIVNARPPFITWVNPRGYQNAWASSIYMVIQTDEISECKYADRKVTGVTSKSFFEDELGRENTQYKFFENNNGYGGNGYVHDTKINLGTGGSTSLPYSFNYSVVCRDMFGEYTPINYSTFSLDMNPPVIDSIIPSSSITYYFLLNVTTNEDTTCKYIIINSTDDVVPFDSPDYRNFYDAKMIPINDDDLLDKSRRNHAESFDNKQSKGAILNDKSYLIYVDCADAAGNLAKNRQFSILEKDLIKLVKLHRVSVNTKQVLNLSNVTLLGVTNKPKALLSFYTNRNSRCFFQFSNMQKMESFDVQDIYLNNMQYGVTNGFNHYVYLAGNDELHSADYYLPQYPDAKFPDGQYSYKVYCTTEFSTDSLLSQTYSKLVPVNGSDPYLTNSKNFYVYSANHSFTIDTTSPDGLIITHFFPDSQNPGVTYYPDRLTFTITKTNLSEDVEYFVVGVSSKKDLGLSNPEIYLWDNITSTTTTLLGLNLSDKVTYYIHAYGVDYAGNVQKKPSVSSGIMVDFASKPTCNDNKTNYGETDMECGGPNCEPCGEGKKCEKNKDCDTNYCAVDGNSTTKICQEYIDPCMNDVKDSSEADVDCGGSCTLKCTKGQSCISSADCGPLLLCTDFSNICDDSCGDGNCDLEYGENEDTCAVDCKITAPEITPQEQCENDNKYWYDDACHSSPKPKIVETQKSGLGLFEWLLIIFCSLILICGGGFMYYMYYMKQKVKNKQQERQQAEIGIQRQLPQISQPVKPQTSSEISGTKKPYMKKRNLSIIDSFSLEKNGVAQKEELPIKLDKKPQKDEKEETKKEVISEEKKEKKKDELDELLERQDEFDKLSAIGGKKESEDFDKLSELSLGEDSEGLDKLSNLDDDFDKLSDLIGDKHATKISDIADSKQRIKKAQLFDTLSKVKSTNKNENKNIFQQVLLYLVKSGKVNGKEIAEILESLVEKDLIDKKDMSEVLFNIEKELR